MEGHREGDGYKGAYSGQIACEQNHAQCGPLCPEALAEHGDLRFTLCRFAPHLIRPPWPEQTSSSVLSSSHALSCLIVVTILEGGSHGRPSPFRVISGGASQRPHSYAFRLPTQHRLSLAPRFLTLTSLHLRFLMCKLGIMTAPAP